MIIDDDNQARHVERTLEEVLDNPRHPINDRAHPEHQQANALFRHLQEALYSYRRERWAGQAPDPDSRH